jgi:hypothetical protein
VPDVGALPASPLRDEPSAEVVVLGAERRHARLEDPAAHGEQARGRLPRSVRAPGDADLVTLLLRVGRGEELEETPGVEALRIEDLDVRGARRAREPVGRPAQGRDPLTVGMLLRSAAQPMP